MLECLLPLVMKFVDLTVDLVPRKTWETLRAQWRRDQSEAFESENVAAFHQAVVLSAEIGAEYLRRGSVQSLELLWLVLDPKRDLYYSWPPRSYDHATGRWNEQLDEGAKQLYAAALNRFVEVGGFAALERLMGSEEHAATPEHLSNLIKLYNLTHDPLTRSLSVDKSAQVAPGRSS